ncbi:MAG: cyclic nucleotide-binding/CBS domain-containing protein [Candidatus Methanoperedens sp.]
MVKISYMMLKNPVVVTSETRLLGVALRMKEYGVRNILVSRNGKLAGIISAWDIMHFLAEKTEWNIPVEKVMHIPELTIESDRWITDALEMCENNNASHIAVAEDGEWIGIIRADDILHTYRFGYSNVDEGEEK